MQIKWDPCTPWIGIDEQHVGFVPRYLGKRFWVIRQSRFSHFESPFLYLVAGNNCAVLFDTGAPCRQSQNLIDIVEELLKDLKVCLIIAHTHSHDDHIGADEAFRLRGYHVLKPGFKETSEALACNHEGFCDLGERILQILWIPGHDVSSIAIYDKTSGIILTGDTFYPGRIWIEDESMFRQTIKSLRCFSQNLEAPLFLGSHVEMSTVPFGEYPEGQKEQLDERSLALTQDHLNTLSEELDNFPQLSTRHPLPFLTLLV